MKSLPKVLSRRSLHLQVININSTLFEVPERLDHYLKQKIMINTITAIFTKVFVCVVKTMSINSWEM